MRSCNIFKPWRSVLSTKSGAGTARKKSAIAVMCQGTTGLCNVAAALRRLSIFVMTKIDTLLHILMKPFPLLSSFCHVICEIELDVPCNLGHVVPTKVDFPLTTGFEHVCTKDAAPDHQSE